MAAETEGAEVATDGEPAFVAVEMGMDSMKAELARRDLNCLETPVIMAELTFQSLEAASDPRVGRLDCLKL